MQVSTLSITSTCTWTNMNSKLVIFSFSKFECSVYLHSTQIHLAYVVFANANVFIHKIAMCTVYLSLDSLESNEQIRTKRIYNNNKKHQQKIHIYVSSNVNYRGHFVFVRVSFSFVDLRLAS
jgi:hypothetical protein